MISMTGFGRGSAASGELEITVELQSVNRRTLETSFSLPKEWTALEPALSALIKSYAQRGRVHSIVSVRESDESGGLHWDENQLNAALSRFRGLTESVGGDWPPNEDALLRLVLALQGSSSLPSAEEAEPLVLEAARHALEAFAAMRAREGEHLAGDLRRRLGLLQGLLAQLRKDASGRAEAYRELLFSRLRNAGLELDLNDERVLKEVALFADRCDVSEELTRLESHLEQFAETMGTGNEAIGRKLEFILQEVLREFNTVGSKANKLEVTRLVIDAKNEIERIREQIQNVE